MLNRVTKIGNGALLEEIGQCVCVCGGESLVNISLWAASCPGCFLYPIFCSLVGCHAFPSPPCLMRSLKPGAKAYLPPGVFQIRIVTDILTKLFKDTMFF